MMQLRAPVFFLALIACAAAFDARAQTANLEADDFSIDLKSGARTYRGNVVFRRGRIRLDCETLSAQYDAEDELQRGVCSGSPARFAQRAQGGDPGMRGSARSITFESRAEKIILQGGAEIVQSGDRIHGARITYRIAEQSVHVDGDGERARMRIAPRE